MNICRDNYEVALFRATSLVAFLCALRVSEVVAAGKEDRVQAALQKDDMQIVERKVCMHIRRSKTDQRGKGEDIAVLCQGYVYALFVPLRVT